MFRSKLLSAMLLVLCSATLASAALDSYLNLLQTSAANDFGAFRADLGAHFQVSAPELDWVFETVEQPSHAPLCLWLARETRQPVDRVLAQYRANHKKGWGALAQSLGIKPGSAAFKALKAGEIGWVPPRGKAQEQADHGGKPAGEAATKGNKAKADKDRKD